MLHHWKIKFQYLTKTHHLTIQNFMTSSFSENIFNDSGSKTVWETFKPSSPMFFSQTRCYMEVEWEGGQAPRARSYFAQTITEVKVQWSIAVQQYFTVQPQSALELVNCSVSQFCTRKYCDMISQNIAMS